MEEQKEITVEQLLKLTADQLSKIAVPIDQIETIGLPIRQAVNNIHNCLAAFENAKSRESEKEKPDEA